MKLIKRLFLLILVLVVLGIGGFWAYRNGHLEKILKKVDREKIDHIATDAQNQTQILTDRAKEASSHVQQVLGEAVQKNEDEPVANQALEYGRYLYCKQVVEEYESNQIIDNN